MHTTAKVKNVSNGTYKHQVRVPDAAWEKLRSAAGQRGLSTNALVLKLIDEFLAANRVPKPIRDLKQVG
jgi:predicted DNA-binding ribbon-helix-helix protein